jgi:uncharacterized protein YqgV (UPF0045/DUF77 family)
MAEKVPSWLERILLPQISEVKGELKAMNARMDGEFRAVHSEIGRVEDKLSSEIARVEETLGTKIDELDKRMDMTERLVKVEEQLKELRAKA